MFHHSSYTVLIFRFSLLCVCWLASFSALVAQQLPPSAPESFEEVMKATQASVLQDFAQRKSVQYTEELVRATQIAQQSGYPIVFKYPKGGSASLQGFDGTGLLKYYTTDNRGGAATISTDEVWPGGSAGTNLTGSGFRINVWDGGRALGNHVELQGKVTYGNNVAFDDHATHVMGTCIAAGVNSEARGMAYGGTGKSWDFNNDMSEIASEASNGVGISNHSYGSYAGWNYNSQLQRWEWWGNTSFSQTEDFKFGYYDEDAASIDYTVYYSPFFLPVKSAGNDRDDTHSGVHWVRNSSNIWVQSSATRDRDGGTGGYDCIPTFGTAKNILTVGAVLGSTNGYTSSSAVVMSSFSGWGPTDDGRIKPDLVAKGVGVASCVAEGSSAYDTYNGTSMSAPMVSGSILLIREHIDNLYPGSSLRASAMKALLIHTADECGSADGPDYRFGWGLMNTQKAVALISNENGRNWFRSRDSITSGVDRTYRFYHNGEDGIKVTIAWTELPSEVCDVPLNGTGFWICDKKLINDLDLRLVNLASGETYFPWRLNPASPSSAATRADNDRDNVEQIHLPSLPAGEYRVVVSHKGQTLVTGEQIFSMMLTGISPYPIADCSAAVPITCGQTLNGTTSGAAQEVPFCDFELNTAAGTWYVFQGQGAPVTFSTCSSTTNFDTKIAVFSGSCGNLVCVTGNDDDENCSVDDLNSVVTFTANQGTTYYIYVTGFQTESGQFQLTASCASTLNVSPTMLSANAAGGTSTISVSGNCSSWTVSESASWLTVSPNSGSNNGSITVSYQTNTSTQSRTANITIAGCGITRTVSITQSGAMIAYPWMPSITGINHTIILPIELSVLIDDLPIEEGDLIGFFFERDGALYCSNFVVWEGSATSCAVYGNDAGASEAKNGFSNGEVFKIKLYKTNTAEEFSAQGTYAPVGTAGIVSHTNSYANDGISMLASLSASSITTIEIPLMVGWNTISSYVLPSDLDLLTLLSPIASQTVLLKNYEGQTVIPSLGINNVGGWNVEKGYQIKVNTNTNLVVTGTQVDPANTPVPIVEGWQIISYLREEQGNAVVQLAGIANQIEVVKNNAGQTYIPAFGINNIGNLIPTQGYKLKATDATTLVYPANFAPGNNNRTVSSHEFYLPVLQHFVIDSTLNTGNNSTIVFPVNSIDQVVSIGDEIGVFTPEGILCGAAAFEGENFAITVWGDDASTLDLVEGMLTDETYHFRIWKASVDQEAVMEVSFSEGPDTYIEDGLSIVSFLNLVNSISNTSGIDRILKVFPNPASDYFEVELPQGARYLELLNAQGQLVLRENQPNTKHYRIHTDTLERGVLFVKVIDEQGKYWVAKITLQ